MDRDPGHLIDLDNALKHIECFARGLTPLQFRQDEKTQAAILYQFTICGEAVRRLSTAFREQHPEIEWSQVIAFRNRITHDYSNIDLETVWKILSKEAPELRTKLAPLLPHKSD